MFQKLRKIAFCFTLMALVMVLALSGLYLSVVRYGLAVDEGPADVIIVLGAAVWPNGPSPALRARVWRGSTLYHEGRAQNLIFCGGLGQYPPAEAEAMAVLARSWEVEPGHIFEEGQSTNTRENIAYAAQIMRENGWQRALIVTDYFHMKRAVLLAREYGIEPLRAPVASKMTYYVPRERFKYTLRECAALLHYTATKYLRRG